MKTTPQTRNLLSCRTTRRRTISLGLLTAIVVTSLIEAAVPGAIAGETGPATDFNCLWGVTPVLVTTRSGDPNALSYPMSAEPIYTRDDLEAELNSNLTCM